MNVRDVELIGDESELVERRVKPLLPKIGRKHGAAIPAIMAAARENAVEYHPDGSVTLGGVTLAADEVEILASPRPGTAVAHDEGLVVVIDTELNDDLRAEGDARELQRASRTCARRRGSRWTIGSSSGSTACPSGRGDHLDGVLAEDARRRGPSRSATDGRRIDRGPVELGAGTVRARPPPRWAPVTCPATAPRVGLVPDNRRRRSAPRRPVVQSDVGAPRGRVLFAASPPPSWSSISSSKAWVAASSQVGVPVPVLGEASGSRCPTTRGRCSGSSRTPPSCSGS